MNFYQRFLACLTALSLVVAPVAAQADGFSGGVPRVLSNGGLSLIGNALGLGGDSGNVTYSSGGLGLGQAGTPGSLTLFGTGSGSVKFVPNTGALGSTVVTWPAITGTIGAAAFLGVGTGVSSAGGLLNLGGDGHLTYTLGSAIWAATDNTLGSAGLRAAWQFGATTNLTTVTTNNFSDEVGMYLPIFNNVGENTFGAHQRAKTTFISLFVNTTDIAAGQRLGFSDQIFCWGMGDCGALNLGVVFGGGPIGGDEGQNFSAVQLLQQQPVLTTAAISSVPTQTLCNTVIANNVPGSSTPQTVNVVSALNCGVGDWVVINAMIPDNTAATEAVKLTAVNLSTNQITGVFQNNWFVGAITAFGAITTPGTGGADGTYNAVALTGGSGTGGKGNFVVSGGVVTSAVISSTQGANYVAGDAVSAAPGGVTGFSVPIAATCCTWNVTPATVLNVSNTFEWGEQRVLVNHTQPSVTAGLASGSAPGGSGALVGIGTSWATNMLTGGTPLNPGCITLAADNYSGPTIANGTFTIPLKSWYEIAGVSGPGQLAIYKTSVANDGSYGGNGQFATFTGTISGVTLTIDPGSVAGVIAPNTVLQGAGITPGTTILFGGSGLSWTVSVSQAVADTAMTASNNTNVGLGTGAYQISPCARILKVASNTQVILDTNSFTWSAADSLEQIVSPYADVHGIEFDIATYAWGGTYRDVMELENRGARTMAAGLTIRSFMQVGGGADTLGFKTGISLDNAGVGITLGPNTPTAMIIGTQNAPICWNTLVFACMAPSAITSGFLISMNGGFGLTNGCIGCLWSYFSGVALNPTPQFHTLEYGGNILSQPHFQNEGTLATAATIGFDPTSGTSNLFEKFMFTNGDGIAENFTGNKMVMFSSGGVLIYGDTGGSDPTGTATALGTVTVFQGGTEAEFALDNLARTQNVTFTVSAAGVLTLGGNGSGSTNGGLVIGAQTINGLAGTGSRPVCVTAAGVIEAGTISSGLVTCP